RYVPCDVTALEQPPCQRLRAFLPPPYPRLGRHTVLEEDELAFRFEDSFHAAQRLQDTGNRAERESAQDGIDGIVLQRDAFARKAEKFNVEVCAVGPLP